MPWIRKIHLELNSTLKRREIKERNLTWKILKSVTRNFSRKITKAVTKKGRLVALAKRLNASKCTANAFRRANIALNNANANNASICLIFNNKSNRRIEL